MPGIAGEGAVHLVENSIDFRHSSAPGKSVSLKSKQRKAVAKSDFRKIEPACPAN